MIMIKTVRRVFRMILIHVYSIPVDFMGPNLTKKIKQIMKHINFQIQLLHISVKLLNHELSLKNWQSTKIGPYIFHFKIPRKPATKIWHFLPWIMMEWPPPPVIDLILLATGWFNMVPSKVSGRTTFCGKRWSSWFPSPSWP